jgi:hypothetical protein
VDQEPLIYREEVRAIIGALADLIVEVRNIRTWLEGNDGEEEGDEAGED